MSEEKTAHLAGKLLPAEETVSPSSLPPASSMGRGPRAKPKDDTCTAEMKFLSQLRNARKGLRLREDLVRKG